MSNMFFSTHILTKHIQLNPEGTRQLNIDIVSARDKLYGFFELQATHAPPEPRGLPRVSAGPPHPLPL